MTASRRFYLTSIRPSSANKKQDQRERDCPKRNSIFHCSSRWNEEPDPVHDNTVVFEIIRDSLNRKFTEGRLAGNRVATARYSSPA